MLKLLVFLLLLFSCFRSFALEAGDIILQPLNCYLCSLIEAEENSPFSHMGIALQDEEDKVWIAEAFGTKVRLVSLAEFLSKTQKGQAVVVLRPREWSTFTALQNKAIKEKMWKTFLLHFHGLPYDANFLWDNDKIYCSELAFKLINPFLELKLVTKPMHFEQNRQAWERYFKGQVPDGEEGVSPADFLRSDLFEIIPHLF